MASLEQLNCPPNEKKSAGILSSNSHRPSSRYSKTSPYAPACCNPGRINPIERILAVDREYIYIYIRGFKNGERQWTMRAIRGRGEKYRIKKKGGHLLCFENTHCSVACRFLYFPIKLTRWTPVHYRRWIEGFRFDKCTIVINFSFFDRFETYIY